MILRDGMQRVRTAVGEGPPFSFDDEAIIRDLNFAARSLTSAAQALKDTYIFNTEINDAVPGGGTYYEQYAMPANVESLLPDGAMIQIGGTLYPLNCSFTEAQLKNGSFVGATPINAYIRRGVNLTQRTPNGGQIVMNGPGLQGSHASFVLGLWPIPTGPYTLFVDYSAYHYQMDNPLDPVLIPGIGEFFDTWTAYPIANGKEAEGDEESSKLYRDRWREGLAEFKNYVFANIAQFTAPTWGKSTVYQRDPSDIGTVNPTVTNLRIQP